ncbi:MULTISPECIES: restriction endonuclease subunit S [Pseudoalteromonas]|uniref:restriction endonuclease subunit S n=1 Tax=Pseudoalteromonas TaxID=53246 RepID=UPI0015831501|nr:MULTISPECIES: restriction endonuclease subunit S [Pseudoalteromonas]MDI4654308.1 restriction endonuclease subunit S [Pseudoalteromonas shioyasakiensis]NUJ40628.1 restriction endonuclease subunit S [Pseudoalteromonas sp. 0303]
MGSEWKEFELGDLIELKRGYDLPKSKREDGSIPIISSSGASGNHNIAKISAPGVVTGRYGTIGEVFYVDEDFWPLNTTLYVKDFKGNDPLFIYYLLKTISFSDYTDKGAVPGINRNHVHKARVKAPQCIKEQKCLGEKLYLFEKRIALNYQTNQTLEQMAQALFKSWFVDFDPVIDNALAAGNDIPEALQHKAEQRKQAQQLQASPETKSKPLPDDIRALFPSEFEQTDEPTVGFDGWIPKGWSAGNLSSLANFTSSRIDGTELTLDNYISTDNMLSNKGGISTASKVPDIKTTPSFKPGDILISNIRPYFQKIWFATFSGGRSNDVLGFEAKNEQCKEYLLNLLYQDVFFDYMMTTSKGSKMPRGDKKAIMDWPVVIPPSSLQKFFSEHVKNYYQVIPIRNKESEALSELRDTLLPKLISGELILEKNC